MFRVRRNDLRAAGRLRRRRRHRRRVQRPADRRVLRLRAGHRHLYAGHLRAGGGRPRIVAVSVVHALGGGIFDLDVQVPTAIDPLDYIPILALGMVCALVGVAIMRGVTLTEELFRRSRVPTWLRPAIGGLAVGMLALVDAGGAVVRPRRAGDRRRRARIR